MHVGGHLRQSQKVSSVKTVCSVRTTQNCHDDRARSVWSGTRCAKLSAMLSPSLDSLWASAQHFSKPRGNRTENHPTKSVKHRQQNGLIAGEVFTNLSMEHWMHTLVTDQRWRPGRSTFKLWIPKTETKACAIMQMARALFEMIEAQTSTTSSFKILNETERTSSAWLWTTGGRDDTARSPGAAIAAQPLQGKLQSYHNCWKLVLTLYQTLKELWWP